MKMHPPWIAQDTPCPHRLTLKDYFRVSWRIWIVTLFVLAVGTGVAIGIFFFIRHSELSLMKQELDSQCTERANMLEVAVQSSLDLTTNYRATLRNKRTLSQQDYVHFAQYSSVDLKRNYAIGFSVYSNGTPAQELELRRWWNMTEVRDDAPTPDSLRLAALYPTSEQTVSFGYNSLQPTAPSRVAAIRKTLRTVEPSLTGVYPLVINGRRGFVLFFPVTDYVFDNGLSKFGTVWLPFAIEPFFEQVYRQIPNDISMSVYDFGPGGNRSEVLPGDDFIWARWSANHRTDDLSYLTSVNITAIDRVWSMDCSPSKPFIAKYTTPWSIISLCVIIFATIVVCLFLHHGLTQFEHAKKEAKLRTKQLQHSSRVMEAISTYSKTVVQLIPDSLIVIDDNGYIIGFNQHAFNETGYDQSDFEQKQIHISQILPTFGENSPDKSDECGGVSPGCVESIVRRQNGTTFSAAVSLSPKLHIGEMQLDPTFQGNIGDIELSSVAQVIIFHDITQIVEYRKRLEQSQEELKSLTVERTDMLLWLCHELRNPIHVVSSTLAEISQVIGKLHQSIDSKVDIDEQMRSASYAFDYVTSIVDDVLEYVGVGIKQSVWGDSQFSHGVLLENIMRYVRKEMTRLSKATNVHYSLSIISDLPHNEVSCLRVNESDEADWITKLLIQLSKLSIQVCHSGSSVFASVAVSSTENDYRLEIVHHIQHASANSLREIIANCKPFSTSQSTQGALFGAPGLKVSLIQKCLQQHHQDSQNPPSLRVKENKVADGGISLVLSTTMNLKSITHAPFTIIDMTVADNLPLTPTESLESLDWSSSTPPPTILIVEDNLLVQRIAQKMVKKLGYKVVLANDGVQAVECVQKSLSSDSKVDLILMDLIMPNMSGDEATEKIRNKLHLTSTQLPIIACTANALETERKRCLDSGLFNNFITKPIKPEQLKAIIESYLGPSPTEE